MTEVQYHPLADRELTATAVFYHSQAVGLGADFLGEARHAEQLLIEYPGAGRSLRGELRRFPLRRFPYDLIYEPRGGALWILAVAHQRRKPGYWAERRAPDRAR